MGHLVSGGRRRSPPPGGRSTAIQRGKTVVRMRRFHLVEPESSLQVLGAPGMLQGSRHPSRQAQRTSRAARRHVQLALLFWWARRAE
ncbi:MAG TPA: hypothetical protein VGW38_06635, partial [Chloroflexota bacterium]|nr:hypothetical protein [Chloroflexota bacterium]